MISVLAYQKLKNKIIELQHENEILRKLLPYSFSNNLCDKKNINGYKG